MPRVVNLNRQPTGLRTTAWVVMNCFYNLEITICWRPKKRIYVTYCTVFMRLAVTYPIYIFLCNCTVNCSFSNSDCLPEINIYFLRDLFLLACEFHDALLSFIMRITPKLQNMDIFIFPCFLSVNVFRFQKRHTIEINKSLVNISNK